MLSKLQLFLVTFISTFCGVFSGDYDYGEVLGKSLLFYEAQRSGKLPATNRVSWRKDAFLTDKGMNGEDLSGGYFDGSGYVKYTFPMASSASILGWGLLEFNTGYVLANQLQNGLNALKWATDYFMKAHPIGKEMLYVVVGNATEEQFYWGRPEDFNKTRPAFLINSTLPGSDAAAETAAALAIASMVFKKFNNASEPLARYREVSSDYAELCLRHAKELYNFSNKYRGKYSDSVPSVRPFYNSYTGYGDELGWAAAWLFKATKDQTYHTDFSKHWSEFKLNHQPTQFSWDWKTAGLQALMATMYPFNDKYSDIVKAFCDWTLFTAEKTPKKLLFPKANEIGALRHAANSAFICIIAATAGNSNQTYINFAKKQMDYILGDSGRSFVIGFGNNPPKSPYHRSSSCPVSPNSCDWMDYGKLSANPNELTGALVGGPNITDGYTDLRSNIDQNEVSLDYNAGFQSTLAALTYFKAQGLLEM